MATNTINYSIDDAVVTLELDDPNQNANTMNEDYVTSMENAVAKVREDHENGRVYLPAEDLAKA